VPEAVAVQRSAGVIPAAEPTRDRRRPAPVAAPPKKPPMIRLTPTPPTSAGLAAPVAELMRASGPGGPVPAAVHRLVGDRLGTDLSAVRVHQDEPATMAADLLEVRAFTVGTHIFLGPGERPTDLPLMAHELTHVVQQQAAAPAVQLFTVSPGDALEREANQASATVTGRTGAPKVQGFSITGWIADKFWDLVETIAPAIVPILRQGVGAWLRERLTDALSALYDKLMAPVRQVTGFIDGLRGHFGNLVTWTREAVARIAKGDCGPIAEAAERIRKVVTGLAAPVIDRVKQLAAKVSGFFTGLWRDFGAPVWDFLKAVGGAAWEKLSQFGNWIWEKTAPVRRALSRAWKWVKNKLGIGEGPEGQDGVLQWVQRKASEAWDWLKAKIEPIKKPLMYVGGILLLLSPAGPLIAIGAGAYGLIRGVTWFASHLRGTGSVIGNRGALEGTIIPGIMGAVDTVTSALGKAASFVTDKLNGVMGGLGQLVGAVGNSILRFAVGAVRWVSEQFRRLAEWARDGLTALAGWIRDGLGRLRRYLQPLLDVLRAFGAVLGDLWQIVKLVLSRAWDLIPACIRDPIVTFLTNQILKRIPLLSSLLAIPDIWGKIRDTAFKAIRLVFVDGKLGAALWTIFRFLLDVLQVPVELVKSILAKAGAAIELIRDHPLQFLKTVLSAMWGGIKLFGGNALRHLFAGAIDWFAGQLQEARITVPQEWTFGGVLRLVMDIAGITLEKVWTLLAKKLDAGVVAKLRKAVDVLTGAWRWVSTLIREGPAGLWRDLQDQVGKLKDMLVDALVGWMTETVVGRAVAQLLTALNPVGAVVNALIAFYTAIKTALQYLGRILGIVDRVLDTVGDLARGVSTGAAAVFEEALAKALPVAIGFLANYLGFGKLGARIREMVEKIQKKVESALEWLIDKAISAGRAILESLGVGGKPDVRNEAYAELQRATSDGLAPELVESAVRDIGTRLRPRGLEQLDAKRTDDRIVVWAAASPYRPLADFFPNKPPVDSTNVRLYAKISTTAPVVVPSGIIPAVGTGRLGYGGQIRIQDRPDTVVVRTWNTKPQVRRPTSNDTHSEFQFVEWITNTQGNDFLRNIRRIEINISKSPCTLCGRDLIGLLHQIVTAGGPTFRSGTGDAVLSFSSHYGGFSYQTYRGLTATTWQLLRELGDAGWTIHAPASAMPRDDTAAKGAAMKYVIHKPPTVGE
jgi:hypothetical protein